MRCRLRIAAAAAICVLIACGLLVFSLATQGWVNLQIRSSASGAASVGTTSMQVGLLVSCDDGGRCSSGVHKLLTRCRPRTDVSTRYEAVIAFLSVAAAAALLAALLGFAAILTSYIDVALVEFVETGMVRSLVPPTVKETTSRTVMQSRLKIGVASGGVAVVCSAVGLGLYVDAVDSWLFCGQPMCPSLLATADTGVIACASGPSWWIAVAAAALLVVSVLVYAAVGASVLRKVTEFLKAAKIFRARELSQRISNPRGSRRTPAEREPSTSVDCQPPGHIGESAPPASNPGHEDAAAASSRPQPSFRAVATTHGGMYDDDDELNGGHGTDAASFGRPRRLPYPRGPSGSVHQQRGEWLPTDADGNFLDGTVAVAAAGVEEASLFWNEAQQLYFDSASNCLYDPFEDEWYNQVTREWFRLSA